MAQESKEVAQGSETNVPRSLEFSRRGIKTGSDFAEMMSALMSDIIEGRINPAVANAACNAGGKLLKMVEMQYTHGQKVQGTNERLLALVPMSAQSEAETIQ